jgi:hypothetical protein
MRISTTYYTVRVRQSGNNENWHNLDDPQTHFATRDQVESRIAKIDYNCEVTIVRHIENREVIETRKVRKPESLRAAALTELLCDFPILRTEHGVDNNRKVCFYKVLGIESTRLFPFGEFQVQNVQTGSIIDFTFNRAAIVDGKLQVYTKDYSSTLYLFDILRQAKLD